MPTSHFHRSRRSLILQVLCSVSCLLMAMTGCQGHAGKPQFGVSGTVTFDDEPVELGTITFFPAESNKAGSTAGAVINQGTYSVPANKGLIEGSYLVRISWNRTTGNQVEATPPYPPGTMIDESLEAIPAKYNTETTLTIEVFPQQNIEDFELRSE